jgi:hypothetical protein
MLCAGDNTNDPKQYFKQPTLDDMISDPEMAARNISDILKCHGLKSI